MEKILISACLVGQKVRYDGQASTSRGEVIDQWRRQGRLVAICPEVAGGLPVPRPAAEIVGGDGESVLDEAARLVTTEGKDVTDNFVAGAWHALQLARQEKIRLAILKARSPSCGSSTIYDGTFSGRKIDGLGVTAALLRRHGIAVFNEEQIEEAQILLAELEMRNIK